LYLWSFRSCLPRPHMLKCPSPWKDLSIHHLTSPQVPHRISWILMPHGRLQEVYSQLSHPCLSFQKFVIVQQVPLVHCHHTHAFIKLNNAITNSCPNPSWFILDLFFPRKNASAHTVQNIRQHLIQPWVFCPHPQKKSIHWHKQRRKNYSINVSMKGSIPPPPRTYVKVYNNTKQKTMK